MIVSLKIKPSHSTDTIPNARPKATLVKQGTDQHYGVSTKPYNFRMKLIMKFPHTLQGQLPTRTLLLNQHRRFFQAPFGKIVDRQL